MTKVAKKHTIYVRRITLAQLQALILAGYVVSVTTR